MAQNYVGIDLGRHEVKLVELRASLFGLQLVRTASAVVVPREDEDLALSVARQLGVV